MAEWWVSYGGEKYQAESLEQIKQWVATGVIPKDSYVFHEVLGKEWLPVSQFLSNTPALSTPSPPTAEEPRVSRLGKGPMFGCLGLIALFFLVTVPWAIKANKAGQARASQAAATRPTSKPQVPAGTVLYTNVACRTKEWYDDASRLVRSKDFESLAHYMLSGKCITLEKDMTVTVTSRGFMMTEFIYQGEKYVTAREAIE